MLDPDRRALYTDALRPPPGYRFERAVATTYSLDLQTLLTIPLHLALFSADGTLEELVEDGVALLEALRRTTDRVTVFAQSARLLAPRQPQVLFGLLEPTVIEVAPRSATGVFHPKLWAIRFRNRATDAERLRLLVLSRTGAPQWKQKDAVAAALALIRRRPRAASPHAPAARPPHRRTRIAVQIVPSSRLRNTCRSSATLIRM